MSDADSRHSENDPTPEQLERLREALAEPGSDPQSDDGQTPVVEGNEVAGVLRLTHPEDAPEQHSLRFFGIISAFLGPAMRPHGSERQRRRFSPPPWFEQLEDRVMLTAEPVDPQSILAKSRQQREQAGWCAIVSPEGGNPLDALLREEAESAAVTILVPATGGKPESITQSNGTLTRRITATVSPADEGDLSGTPTEPMSVLNAEPADDDPDDGFNLVPVGGLDVAIDEEIELQLTIDQWPDRLRILHAETAPLRRPLDAPLSKTFEWAELHDRVIRPAAAAPASKDDLDTTAKTVAAESTAHDTATSRVASTQQTPEPENSTSGSEAELAEASQLQEELSGRYQLIHKLGEGGFGTVWRAEQLDSTRRQVALKIIKPGQTDRETAERFAAERDALAKLDHPNVVKLVDDGSTTQGRSFFAMEFIEGMPMSDASVRQRLPFEQRVRLLKQIADALGYAHKQGVVHRDIKPSNVMITQAEGQPVAKVVDFGLALSPPESAREESPSAKESSLLSILRGELTDTMRDMLADDASGLVVSAKSERLDWICFNSEVMVTLDGSQNPELDGCDAAVLMAELHYSGPEGPESHARPVRLKKLQDRDRALFTGSVKLRIPSVVNTTEVTLTVRNVEPADLPLLKPELRRTVLRSQPSAVWTSRRLPTHVSLTTTADELGDLSSDPAAAFGLCVVEEGGAADG